MRRKCESEGERREREGRQRREGGRGECGTRRRGADAESSWQAPGIARDRPGSASNSAPPFSSLTLSHTSSIKISCFPPLSRSQRPPLPPYDLLSPQNGATPALKLGSAVLTAHDSWDTPPIVRFSRPSLVDIKPDTGRQPPPFRTSRPLPCLGGSILGMWPLSPRLVAHLISHLVTLA